MKTSRYSHLASFREAETRPLRVGRRFWVGPAGATPPEEEGLLPIWLGAGPAFGTGAHPTTQLCLRALDRHLRPGTGVLDLGTGSGILAIAAARLGAESVVGIDIDPEAVAVARANLLLNAIDDRLEFQVGSLNDVLGQGEGRRQYACVLANILAHILVEMFAQGLPQAVEPGGCLILSGFLPSQAPLLRAAVAAAELELLAEERQDEWICMIARRRQFS